MYLRIFASAVDPSDVPEIQRIFAEDVKPVFEAMIGCRSMELAVGTKASAGGLVDGAAISRWEDLDCLSAALGSRGAAESMVRMLPLLQLEPVIKTFEVAG